MYDEHAETEAWLRKMLRNAPKPLPLGVFPRLLNDAEREGFEHGILADVVDEWLNYGYCRIIDPVSDDIELTPEGERYFGRYCFDDDAR